MARHPGDLLRLALGGTAVALLGRPKRLARDLVAIGSAARLLARRCPRLDAILGQTAKGR